MLRVPDDTAGQQAQCPQCSALSTIPAAAPVREPFAPLPSGEPSRGEAHPFRPSLANEPTVRFGAADMAARDRVSGPATAMIVLSAISMVLQLVSVPFNLLNAGRGQNWGGFVPDMAVGVNVTFGLLGVVIAGIVLAGGIKMRTLESYSLAMAASILMVIPCISPCCILSIPFGIWSLVVLSDSSIKAAFRS
jgi:hypothetical protein